MPPGQKGFQKGHAHLVAKAARALASEVRSKVPADLMVDWHLAIIMWKDPQVVAGEDGLEVVWAESGGVIPDTGRRDASIAWLANRGHGQAAQLLQIEQTTRLDITASTIQIGSLPPAVLLAVRDALRLSSAIGDAGAPTPDELGEQDENAIDVESTEVAEDASTEQDANANASTPHDET